MAEGRPLGPPARKWPVPPRGPLPFGGGELPPGCGSRRRGESNSGLQTAALDEKRRFPWKSGGLRGILPSDVGGERRSLAEPTRRNRGDLQAMVADLAPNFEYATTGAIPGMTGVYRGSAGGSWGFSRGGEGEFERPRIEAHELVDAGDQVVAAVTLRGRGKQSGVERVGTSGTSGPWSTARSCTGRHLRAGRSPRSRRAVGVAAGRKAAVSRSHLRGQPSVPMEPCWRASTAVNGPSEHPQNR